jgi:alkyl sulfatase BDS1-like metallo-beta-lactamase superfamily hydrolase
VGGIHRERPGADAITPATGDAARPLGDGIWVSPGLSNSYLIECGDERVVVNTGMGFEGPLHRRAFDAVNRAPTRAIVLTQGHVDHVGGVDVLRDDDTAVIAQAGYEIWRADNERLMPFRARNAAFAWAKAIAAATSHARDLPPGATAQARPEPTVTFDTRLDYTVGGRDLVLLSTPGGETTDALVVWLPDCQTLLTGNLFGALFGHVPNLVTMRGDRYRDALAYVDSLQTVLDLSPDRLVTGHFGPVDGVARIAEEVEAMRAATRWVHDATVDGMNAGRDVHTLMREVRIPVRFDLGEGYGKTSWNVRAIWETYAGWFHHRSTTELYEVPASAVAPDVVAAAGAGALVEAARRRLQEGDPVGALHLTDIVLAAAPGDPGAREAAADATRALLASSVNFWERAWLTRALDQLEGR